MAQPTKSMQGHLKSEEDLLIFKGLTDTGIMQEVASQKSIVERNDAETASAIQDFKNTVNILDNSLENTNNKR